MIQGHTPGLPNPRATDSDEASPIPEESVREELQRVLSGHEFRSSKRSQEFLRYVVENTLAGREETLKERTIGIEVFGRPASYDPSEDATVRVKAGEVRKRLGLYYAGEGLHSPLRIELPSGTYVPEFRRANGTTVHEHPAGEETTSPALPPSNGVPPAAARSRRYPIIVFTALAALAAAALYFTVDSRRTSALDEFWKPVLQGSAPVSVCAAFVPVYWPDRTPNASDPLRVADFTLLNDQFVGGGDLIAVSRVSSLLTRNRRPYHVRIGSEISLHDLEAAPAILVGYSYTRWREISSALRFFIDASKQPIGITDNGKTTGWTLPNLPPDRHTSEDYAIVTRVLHPDTHAMLIEIAGVTQYGTDAASDMVTNADLMNEAFRGAPADWPNKNVQLVLHVKVISGAPSSPRVVARHFW
jgi:hypothetical protein